MASLRDQSAVRKEILIVLLAVGAMAALPTSTPSHETLYQGFLTVEADTLRETDGRERVWPTLALAQTPNGSVREGAFFLMLPPAQEPTYPLSEIAVRCGPGAPALADATLEAFSTGLRRHCRFRLPADSRDRLQLAEPSRLEEQALRDRRFYFSSLPSEELLIRCRALVPMAVTADDRSFSAWVKANCSFVPSSVP